MATIILTTLNARYIHAAFGLRYLLANLGELQDQAELIEFDINQRPVDIAAVLLARNPRIIGIGIYIWNVAPATELVAILKRLRPQVTIVLGGPEVSYETDTQVIVQLADFVISGEADLTFPKLCKELLGLDSGPGSTGHTVPWTIGPGGRKVVPAELPDFSRLKLPYEYYSAEDIANRIIYVEASRGCPFTCEFCLSSLDIPVRQVPLESLLTELRHLLERGVKHFKFVDRTFNLNIQVSRAILQFFLERYQPGHFFHFEMIPDRLPDGLREVIARFPAGALQFEVGIQTFNPAVSARIKRRQNYERLEQNLRFLRQNTGVHIHADLIAGLPGESIESFALGFDRLIGLAPQEIQVGLLKRLRGTPIAQHDSEWRMVYNPHPPYEILQNQSIDFRTMQQIRRFARFWDLIGNSGNFVEATPLIWKGPASNPGTGRGGSGPDVCETARPNLDAALRSPFWEFMRLSEWVYQELGRTDSIPLVRLMELLFNYLTGELEHEAGQVAHLLWNDYQRGGRHDKPAFLRQYLDPVKVVHGQAQRGVPKRQRRYLGLAPAPEAGTIQP